MTTSEQEYHRLLDERNALTARVTALEGALRDMLDAFVVEELHEAWRWDPDEGVWDLIEPYANAAINARALLDPDATRQWRRPGS